MTQMPGLDAFLTQLSGIPADPGVSIAGLENIGTYAERYAAGAPERDAKRAQANDHFDRFHASRPMPWEVK